MAHCPGELITVILECLPVKSVLRFRCLSKPFLAIINTPDFKNAHLRRSSQNISRRKLILAHTHQGKVYEWDDGVEEEIALESLPSHSWRFVCGYCNGLILLYEGGLRIPEISLSNPSMHKYTKIPECPLNNPQQHQMIALGLGYDGSIDDYKVVLIVSKHENIQVWIYRMRSKIWRSVHHNFPNSNTTEGIIKPLGHFADGSLHWLGDNIQFQVGASTSEVVAFDVRTETFSLLPLPLVYPINRVSTRLHVLEGHLCVSFYNLDVPRADLYMRKDGGFDQFIWEQVYSIREPEILNIYFFKMVKVLGYSKSKNKILLNFPLTDRTASYDVEERSVEMLEKYPKQCAFMFPCSESLVWF